MIYQRQQKNLYLKGQIFQKQFLEGSDWFTAYNNEKCLFSNTQEFLHNIFVTCLNRHQRFIHSVGGFKKPIYMYTKRGKGFNLW